MFVLAGAALIFQALVSNAVIPYGGVPGREALDRGLDSSADLVFFGDSVFRGRSKDDTDHRDLVTMVSDLTGRPAVSVDHPGYAMEVYESFVQHLVRQSHRPTQLVFAINLRSFGPDWDMAPGWQFERRKLRNRYGDLVALTVMQPLFTFRVLRLSPVTEAEYLELPVFQGERQVGKVRDFMGPAFETFSDDNVRKRLLGLYLYRLTPEHRKVKAMVRIVELCVKNGMKPYFYVTPSDLETGQQFVGPEFRTQVNANTNVMGDVLASNGAAFADFSGLLRASDFCWREDKYPTEHLNERGRAKLVERIVRFIGSPE